MPLQIRITTLPVERGDKKVLRDALREGMRTVAMKWHSLFKQLKFSNAAETRYDLEPRAGDPGSMRRWKGSYQSRKLKKYGHTRPFELTGTSRTLAMGSRKVDVAAQNYQSGRSAAIVIAPQFNQSRVGPAKVPLRLEFEKVLPEETKRLNALGVKSYDLSLARARRRRTKVVK